MEGDSMFDELAIFDIKLILRDPADLYEYKKIITILKQIDFITLINNTLLDTLAEHDLLLSVKPETKVMK